MTRAEFAITRIAAATPELLPELERLYGEFAVLEHLTTPLSQFMDFVHARLDDETMLAAVALREQAAAGYALCFDVATHPFIPTWERSGYVTNLYVRPAYQRQGLGQTLFEYAMQWLAGRGVRQVMLNVAVHNETGHKFWRQQGFEPILVRMRRSV